MHLAPTRRNDERGIDGVEGGVHGAVDIMQMRDLARVLAGRVEMVEARVRGRCRRGEEEGQAVFLETGHPPCQQRGVALDQAQEGGAEFVVEGGGAALGYLAVGDDAGDAGARVGALGQVVQVGGGWVVGFGEGGGLEAVGDGEEAEVGDAEVVGEGAGDAALAEGEEFVVAFEDGAEESGGQEEDES